MFSSITLTILIKVCELWPSWDPLGSHTWVSILWNFTARCRKKYLFFVSSGEWIEWIGLQQRIDVTVHVCGVHTVEPPCILRALKHGIASIRRIHNCVTHPAIYKCLEPYLWLNKKSYLSGLVEVHVGLKFKKTLTFEAPPFLTRAGIGWMDKHLFTPPTGLLSSPFHLEKRRLGKIKLDRGVTHSFAL